MTGILTINPGISPDWWLSPDIWVTKVGSSTAYGSGTEHPIAGETYNVSVRVHDNYPSPNSVPGGTWNLPLCSISRRPDPSPPPPADKYSTMRRSFPPLPPWVTSTCKRQ